MTTQPEPQPTCDPTDYLQIRHLAVSDEMSGFDSLPPAPSLGAKLALRFFGQEITNYGFNKLVKQHLNWGDWLPLSLEVHHGWYTLQAPRDADLKKDLALILVFNARQAEAWRRKSNVPVEILGAPFIHYRRREGIGPAPAARGTIAFPAHSGTKVETVFDVEQYCKNLADLPAELQPVNICMHDDDIKRGRHRDYLRRGFRVYSAGGRKGQDFAQNFYKILAEHKYASSNVAGSYLLYSVEMGVPFFFCGPSAEFRNFETTDYESEPVLRQAGQLFKDFSSDITAEQLKFVLAESGMDDCAKAYQLRPRLQRAVLCQPFRKLFRKILNR